MDINLREVTSSATLEEKKKLRKEFNYLDMIFYTLAALIGLDTIGAFAANGAQSLTWLVISAITFLVPYALLTAELGSTFTQEGGMYVWCKMAGGRFFAALGAMMYWVSNPLWLGGTLAVGSIAAIKSFWFGSLRYQFGGNPTTDAAVEILIALFFVWGTIWCAILSLRVGKYISVFGSYLKLALLGIFVILAVIFLFTGHSKGGSLNLADLVPTNFGLIVSAILPILIFQWQGFEVQNGAGEEMENPQRDVPRSIIRAGIVAVVAYAAFLITILLVLPKDQLTNVGGFLTAFKSVSTVLGPLATPVGWLVALAFAIALASSGGTWIMGADRTYAISALDRTAPLIFGRFSAKYGTPIAVNLMSGIMATIAMVAAILVNAFGSGNITTLFSLVLGFVISTATLAYLFMFPSFLILRYKYPNVPRTYRVPGGMVGAWIVTLLPFTYALVAVIFILVPSTLPGSVTRLTYELTQFIPLVFIVLLTIVFYIIGHNERSNQDVLVEMSTRESEVGEV
ncbi:MAG TPA: APC family permease [Ktedonobacteraceae bacterium]|jgi:glutamate:GABA antiporter